MPGLPTKGDLTSRSSHPLTVNRFHVDNESSLCKDEQAYSDMWMFLGIRPKTPTSPCLHNITAPYTAGLFVLVSSPACQ